MKNKLQKTNSQKSWLSVMALLGFLFLLSSPLEGQITIWTEDFETNGNTINGGDGRYASPEDFYDGSSDFWGRVNVNTQEYYFNNTSSGSTTSNASGNYGGSNGNFFYAGEDLDDDGGDLQDFKEILFTGINIAGATNLVFKGLFARGETDGCSSSTYDDEETIQIFYEIDGGGEVQGMCFHHDAECNIAGDISNEPFHHDPNCDGDGGEGDVLSNGFAEFSFSIMGTGSLMDIRVFVLADASGEEMAMDFFRLESMTALPVVLTRFEAENQEDQVKLSWATQTEVNNAGFQIQRSVDGSNWEKIGFEQGQGNATATQNYQFFDTRPLNGESFYRIRQVDFDGQDEFSEIKSVRRIKDQLALTVAPNPFDQDITLNLNKGLDKDTQVEVLDHLGRRVDSFLLEKDQQNKSIDLSQLNAGIYFLRFQNGNDLLIERIVKF